MREEAAPSAPNGSPSDAGAATGQVRRSPADPLTITVTKPDESGNAAVVTLAGDLDPSTVALLSHEIDLLLTESTVDRLVLDLTGVEFIDSSGLRALVDARRALEGRGPLVLRSPTPATRRLLEITGLHQVVEID